MIVILSIMTVVVTIAFTGIAVWAWSDKNKASFDQAARIPLDDNDFEDGYRENAGHG